VVIDVDCLSPDIAAQFLDEFAGHSSAPEVGGVPVAAAVRPESLARKAARRSEFCCIYRILAYFR
jgi:hypothetical protein